MHVNYEIVGTAVFDENEKEQVQEVIEAGKIQTRMEMLRLALVDEVSDALGSTAEVKVTLIGDNGEVLFQ